MKTLTDFINEKIKDKDQAHEVDQKIRNLVTPYLSDKEDIRNALYGETKKKAFCRYCNGTGKVWSTGIFVPCETENNCEYGEGKK